MLRLLIALGVVVLAASSSQGARAQPFLLAAEPAGERLAAPAQGAGALAPRDDELPWCVSADDPRCAPLRGSSSPMGADLRIPAGVVGDTPGPSRQPKRVQKFTASVGLVPHAGIRNRVERPPRTR